MGFWILVSVLGAPPSGRLPGRSPSYETKLRITCGSLPDPVQPPLFLAPLSQMLDLPPLKLESQQG